MPKLRIKPFIIKINLHGSGGNLQDFVQVQVFFGGLECFGAEFFIFDFHFGDGSSPFNVNNGIIPRISTPAF